MSLFKYKKITLSEDIGQMLKTARENKKLSLEQAAKFLKIDTKYLLAMEENNWHALPGEFYLKIFAKKYAALLGIKWINLKKIIGEEAATYKKWSHGREKTKEKITALNLIVWPKILKKIIIAAVFFLFLSYLSYQVWQISNPPQLTIITPNAEKTVQTNYTVAVTGQTDNKAHLLINSQEVIPDETGFFSLSLDLSAGSNIIKIEATKKYSKSAVIYREVVVNKATF